MRNLTTRICPRYQPNENSLFRLIMNSKASDQLHQLAGMFSYPVVLLANKLASIFNDADEEKYHYIAQLINFEQRTTYQPMVIRGLVQTLEQHITNTLPIDFNVHTIINSFSRVSLHNQFVNSVHLITNIRCRPICQKKLKFEKTEIIVHDIEQWYSATLFIGKCTHSYSNLTTKQKQFIAYPNFVLKNRTKEFTTQSFDNGKYIFIHGHHPYSRDLLLLFESEIVELRASFMGFADTLNSFSDRRSTPRVKIDRRHLEESFLAYQLVQFDLFMGQKMVSIPHYFVDLSNDIFCQFPRRYIAFVYFWSNHKSFVGPCSSQCSEAAVMDGHVKSRRRICNYKDAAVSTSEYEKIVKGCHATPVRDSKYCPDHAFANNDESKTPETSIQPPANGERFPKRTQVRWSTDCEQQTSCKTLKRKVNAYVRKCTRSFGLIAQVFNCWVITAFSEIYRSETIKQILDMIFTAIRSKLSLLLHVPLTNTTLFALSLKCLSISIHLRWWLSLHWAFYETPKRWHYQIYTSSPQARYCAMVDRPNAR